MKESQMHVMMDICTQLERLGMTRSELAETMCIEPNTVNKQLVKQNGELTLATAYRYAAALKGAILFLPDEDVDLLRRSKDLQAEADALRQELASLRRECEDKETRLNRLSATIEKVQTQNDRFALKLEEKDAEIYRQSETVRRLLEKYAL